VEEVIDPKKGIAPLAHYEAFAEWAKKCGLRPVSEKKFGEMANERGLHSRASMGGKQIRVHRVRIIPEESMDSLLIDSIMEEV
jgi:hypothetical protein